MKTFRCLTALVWIGLTSAAAAAPAQVSALADLRPADLFQSGKVWEAHLTFTPENWAEMQPKTIPADTLLRSQVASGLQGGPGRRNGLAGLNGILFDFAKADLEFAGTTFRDVAVRYKGNGTITPSRGTMKFSLKVDLNKNVKGQKIAGLSEFNFHSNIRDPAGMNELLAYRMFREIQVPAPRVTYLRLHITVPGLHDRTYAGLFTLVEDINEDFAGEQIGTREGALFKPVTPNLFGYRGPDWAAYEGEWDPKTELTEAQKARVIEFTRFVTFSNDQEFAARIGSFVEVGQFARYMAGIVYLANFDGVLLNGQNVYVHLDPRTNRFSFVPWDQDESWGAIVLTVDQRNSLNIHRPWISQVWFIMRMFKLEEFQRPYYAALADLALRVVPSDRMARQQDELVPVVRPLAQAEGPGALATFDLATNPGFVPRLTGGSAGSYLSIKSFTAARELSVLDQLIAGR